MITELGWEEIDGYTYAEGESTHSRLFYDRAAAEAECRRLCEAFFAAWTPVEFKVDCEAYHQPGDDETVTWAELREAGFPDPYYVHQLHTTQENTNQ